MEAVASRAEYATAWRELREEVKSVRETLKDSAAAPLSLDGVGLSHVSAADHHLAAAEADFAAAKTSVWWDIDNCEVPKGCDANGIAQSIRSVLLKNSYCGSLIISAYGDTNRIPSSVQRALYSTGVLLNHVPSGVKDGSDKKIHVDMMLWAMENQAPANLMLISGDRDFSYVLHQLGMKRYNILLAQPEKASPPHIAAAKTVWLWTSIVTVDSPDRPIASGGHRRPIKRMDPVRGTKRQRSFCELCNVACSNHDLTIHLSGKRHRTKAVLVARERPLVSNSTEPKSAWRGVCQIGFRSEAWYESHILGTSHQSELEDQAERSQNQETLIVSSLYLE